MAEYLAPGVYVEEFDSGIKAMEGVGTSTAGFIGMASRGPTIGKPQLITGIAEFRKYFGGYLGEEYGKHRFLSYSIEQFFANGGSTCYVMRVANSNDKVASLTIENTIQVNAKNPGTWGNSMKIDIRKVYNAKTYITKKCTDEENHVYKVKSTAGFYVGDTIEINNKKTTIMGILDDSLLLKDKLEEGYLSEGATPSVFLYSLTFDFIVTCDDFMENFEKCSLNSNAPTFIQNATAKSDFVTVTCMAGPVQKDKEKEDDKDTNVKKIHIEDANKDDQKDNKEDKPTTDTPPIIKDEVNVSSFYSKYTTEKTSYVLSGGTTTLPSDDCADLYMGKDDGPTKRTGLQSFLEISDVSIMAIPGITNASVQSALITHCESTGNRFAILDAPGEVTSVDELKAHREQFDTTYAAMYHPWLSTYDALLKKNILVPPSATMAGVYARVDNTRGVWKAPANEVVRNVTGLGVTYNEAEQGKLNPHGINLIRTLPGMGIRVWGARTCSSDGNWKYINVRRLFIYLEESIKANTGWAVFEPNDENLWSRVSGTIRVFLTTLWREGALAGSTGDEAFFVNVGKSTMTQDDILNGRLICVIGVAPVRPAEFVIFRITQKMEDAS